MIKGFFEKEEKEVIINKQDIKKLQIKKDIYFPTGKSACNKCGLYKQKRIQNPKLKPYGLFKKKILVIGEGPGRIEDENERPFDSTAMAGSFLHKQFKKIGLNLYKDAITINSVDCRPIEGNSNRKPTGDELRYCYYRKDRAIKKYKPKFILLLGEQPRNSFFGFNKDRKDFKKLSGAALRGKIIPDKNSNAWIYYSYHPNYIQRSGGELSNIFALDMKVFSKLIKKNKRPIFEDFSKNIKVLTKYIDVFNLFQKIYSQKLSFSFDYETSSYRYYEKIHEIYLISIHIGNITYDIPMDFPRKKRNSWWNERQRTFLLLFWKDILEDKSIKKSAQNIKHEAQASHYILNTNTKGWDYDTMIGAHVIDEAKRITGLKTQAYLNFGIYNYGIPSNIIGAPPKQKNLFSKLPFDIATEYCGMDSKITDRLIPKQKREIKKKKLTKAYNLFHEGVQAFAEIERNGIKIDVPLANRLSNLWGNQIEDLKEKILSSREAKKFEKKKHRTLNYKKKLSNNDLRTLLYDVLKFEPIKETKTTYSVDEEVLKYYAKKHDCSILSHELEYRKLDKMRNTYLSQFLTYEVDGFIYPTFNLHIPESYRSSSSEPSIHSIPKRFEDAWEIRQVITTRWLKSGYIVEVDYGSMEVRIIACVTHDPALMEYIVGGGDMHGDWAEIIFKIKENEISEKKFKEYRYIAKNHWVFPLFYGSWYGKIAQTTTRPKWFKTYEQWENHLKKCEQKFWKQFKGVREWQDRLVKSYKCKGYIRDLSWGFIRHGYLSRNKIYNFPIQGPAYHCLQWTINELWRKNFYNLQSLLCGQIHDALFWDAKNKEIKKLKRKVDYLMTEKIREENPWITVPLITEWSKGKNWAEMEES